MSLPPNMPPPPMDYGAPMQPVRTGAATTALVLGLIAIPTTFLCFGPLLGIVAIILGIIAIVRAGGQPERFGGKGRAVVGIITGGLSCVLLVFLIPLVIAVLMPFVGAGVNLTLLGQSLQAYHASYEEYPPDLATLAASGKMVPNPLGETDQPSDIAGDTYYVVGVKPSDPPHWIVAYSQRNVFGVKIYVLLYVNGDVESLDQGGFQRMLASFKKEFEADRGQPPTILEPKNPPAGEP